MLKLFIYYLLIFENFFLFYLLKTNKLHNYFENILIILKTYLLFILYIYYYLIFY